MVNGDFSSRPDNSVKFKPIRKRVELDSSILFGTDKVNDLKRTSTRLGVSNCDHEGGA